MADAIGKISDIYENSIDLSTSKSKVLSLWKSIIEYKKVNINDYYVLACSDYFPKT